MFECHITIYGDKEIIQRKIKALDLGHWHFSAIDGDPDLGSGVKCYLTRHFDQTHRIMDLIGLMDSVKDLLISRGLTVLREKVELIVYDIKL